MDAMLKQPLCKAGLWLIALGVLGEYIGRIFDEVKQRPLYLVAGRAGQGLAGDGAVIRAIRLAQP